MGIEEMLLQKGDIINVKGKEWISDIIKYFTKSSYSHTAMYIGNNRLIESNWGGVKVIPADRYVDYDVYRHNDATGEQLNKACKWALTKVGRKYDYWGIFGIMLSIIGKNPNNPFDQKQAYWCSELVADSYLNSGIMLCVSSNTATVSPQTLAECPNLKQVWGYIKNKEDL